MIKKYIDPIKRIDEHDKKEIRKALKSFRDTVIFGAAYHVSRELLQSFVNPGYQSYEPDSFIFEALNSGIDLSSFGLVESVLGTIYKPKLFTLGQWIRWTTATSVATTLAVRAVKVPIVNMYVIGKFSYFGYFDGIVQSSAHSIGFNTTVGVAHLFLPRPKKMGGQFAKSTAAMTLGNLGGTIASAPFFMYSTGRSFKSIISGFVSAIPGIMFDNAMYSIVKTVVSNRLKQ